MAGRGHWCWRGRGRGRVRGHLVRVLVLHVPKQTPKAHLPIFLTHSLGVPHFFFSSSLFYFQTFPLLLCGCLVLVGMVVIVGRLQPYPVVIVVVVLFPDYFCNCCLSCCGYISRICLYVPSKLLFRV